MGNKPLPGIAAEDIGRCAYGIFKAGAELAGKTVGISGEHLTGEQMAEALATALGQPVSYAAVPLGRLSRPGLPGRGRPGEHVPVQARLQRLLLLDPRPDFSRQLNPQLQTFADWLETNKAKIPLE